MRGDVLFYSPSRGNLVENVIARATHGKFCHVAIDCGAGWVIEAKLSGIARDDNIRKPDGVWRPPVGADINAGLGWLGKQIGLRYGLLDIFDQLPRLLHLPIAIIQPRGYDCSDLATRYLMHAGVDVGPLSDAPHLVTPNDLARQLGILPKES